METLYFTIPAKEHEAMLADYAAEHRACDELHLHGSSQYELHENYEAWLASLLSEADPQQAAAKGWVQSTTLLCLRKEDGRLIGLLNIRHTLNDFLARYGGNIGYGVRPTERGKGYGTEMLRHALRFCAGLGMEHALVSCSKHNTASAAVILRCGGVLQNEYDHTDGDTVQLYSLRCGESPIGLLRGTVALLPHDPVWDSLGQSAALTCRSILGSLCPDAQHVGSSSVEELAAKPILDIAAGVTDMAATAEKLPQLEAAGFIHVPESSLRGEIFCSAGSRVNDVRTHHIHITPYGGTAWRQYIAFRDRLRTNEAARSAYGQLKAKLQAQNAADRVAYTAGKADFIQEHIAKSLT